MIYFIYLITGFLAGLLGGLLGTGGCALIMPVLRFGFHFSPAVAIGTTLTAVVFTASSGAIQHLKMRNVEKKTAIFTGFSGMIGVIIGSFVFNYIKQYGSLLDLIIGLAFIVVSIRMIYEGIFLRGQTIKEGEISGSTLTKIILGLFIGFLTGIVGLGGGYALVPSYIYLLKAPVKIAVGTSMATFVWIALVGALFKFFQGVVNVGVAVTLGIGALMGAIYGAKLVTKFKPNILKTLFGLLFFYVSLKYILIYFNVYI